MANKKISALTAATVVNDTDLIPIVQGGVNKKATRALFSSFEEIKILDPENPFFGKISVHDLTEDIEYDLPTGGGTVVVIGNLGEKQIPYSSDGKIFDSNEDFIFDIDTATLGIGAMDGNGTITSQTDANVVQPNTSDLGVVIKGALGGTDSGNGGSVYNIGGNARGGNGNGGDVLLTPGNGIGSGKNGSIKSTGILEFADNAAAIAGGLAVGTHYRTGDFQKIVH